MKTDRLLAVSAQGETHQVLRMVPTGTMPAAFGGYEVQGHSMPSYYLVGGGRLVPSAVEGELVENGTGLRLTILEGEGPSGGTGLEDGRKRVRLRWQKRPGDDG